MPTTLPRTVRDAWGEEVADEFSGWLDEHFQKRTVSRGEFREILSRLDVLEERFDQQDARLKSASKPKTTVSKSASTKWTRASTAWRSASSGASRVWTRSSTA